MRLYKKYSSCLALIILSVLAGCTKVELCDMEIHPHLSQVAFSYDWNGYENEKPDSLTLVVSRIVDTYHDAFSLSSSDMPASENGPVNADTNGSIGLRSGEYFMMTFNRSDRLIVQNLDTFLADKQVSLKDLSIRIKALKRDEIPQLGGELWVDFNPGYSYVSNEGVIFMGKMNNVKLFTGISASLRFAPKPLTQKINLDFKLEMLPDEETHEVVEVEEVIAEMSGVATTIYPVSGLIRATSFGRFIFQPKLINREGQVYNYRGVINAFGLVGGEDVSAISGLGVLRLGVYVKLGDKKKILRVSANLSEKIKEAGLTRYSDDGNGLVKARDEGTIRVEQELKISPEAVSKESPDGVSGWHVEEFIDFDV